MADDADLASKTIEDDETDKLNRIRAAAAKIPAGAPGECEECDTYFARIVDGKCARCRDAAARRAAALYMGRVGHDHS